MTKSPRLELAGGSPPASWPRHEMRDAIHQVRRFERGFELFGTNKSSSPTANVIADMLGQLLDETEAVSGSRST